MANAGFTVIGDSGVFQVDGSYRNLVLREKGTVTTNNSFQSGASFGNIALRSGFTTPILFTGGSIASQPAAMYSAGQVGWQISTSGAIGTVVPYYIFDVPQAFPTGSGFGIEVSDAAGTPIFSAPAFPLRVVNFQQNVAFGTAFTGVTGKTYAVTHVVPGYQQLAARGFEISAEMTAQSGAAIVASDVVVSTSNVLANIIQRSTIIVADVTGY